MRRRKPWPRAAAGRPYRLGAGLVGDVLLVALADWRAWFGDLGQCEKLRACRKMSENETEKDLTPSSDSR